MTLRTYKYRLYPTKPQEKRLFQVLSVCRHWYNMCLEEHKLAWELEGRQVTKSEQEAKGKHYRKTFPQAKVVFSQTMQSVADNLDKAFRSFFRRIKAGEKAGYPRFKGRNRFNSFSFKQFGVGAWLDGNHRLRLFGIGRVRVRWHRAIPDNGIIKTCCIKHEAGQWYVTLAVELTDSTKLSNTENFLGLDMGISALITTSKGVKVENPNYYRAGQVKLRVLNRALSRKKRSSKNRRKALKQVQRQHMHVSNQRSNYLHNLSTRLVQTCDGVALEDLATRNMVRNHHLSKSILDSGWGIFKQYLTYKASGAGCEIRFVDPAYTSQTCPQCGKVEKIGLSVRWVDCECGLSLDRDHRAAINILRKAGWDAPLIANVSH